MLNKVPVERLSSRSTGTLVCWCFAEIQINRWGKHFAKKSANTRPF